MLIAGKCHCGIISFSLTWDPDPSYIPARACGCSFCKKHGAVWTSNPRGALRILVRDPALVSEYAFGTENASFHTCAGCGIVPVATSLIDGALYAVVNVNSFEGVEPSFIHRESMDFDGEDEKARVRRWKRNWIAHVEYVRLTEAIEPESL
jgi:hypothetical protein